MQTELHLADNAAGVASFVGDSGVGRALPVGDREFRKEALCLGIVAAHEFAGVGAVACDDLLGCFCYCELCDI